MILWGIKPRLPLYTETLKLASTHPPNRSHLSVQLEKYDLVCHLLATIPSNQSLITTNQAPINFSEATLTYSFHYGTVDAVSFALKERAFGVFRPFWSAATASPKSIFAES